MRWMLYHRTERPRTDGGYSTGTSRIRTCFWLACVALASQLQAAEPYPLKVAKHFPAPNVPADNPLTVEGVDLGRHLFYDNALSRYSVLSCNNCHEQHSAFSDTRRFSIGFDGDTTRRNSMPLFNLAYHPAFFWDGRAPTLRAQALKPIEDRKEMGEKLSNVIRKLERKPAYAERFSAAFGDPKITSDRIGLAIEQFMLSLISDQARYDQVQEGTSDYTPEEQRGHDLFFAKSQPGKPGSGANCFQCHTAPLFTNNQFTNNGTGPSEHDKGYAETSKQDEDLGKFKTPSLRNIAVTQRYMHDTRFKTLEEVLNYYNEGVTDSAHLDPHMKPFVSGLGLSAEQKSDLLAFLHTLTDEAFLKNTAHQNPHPPRKPRR